MAWEGCAFQQRNELRASDWRSCSRVQVPGLFCASGFRGRVAGARVLPAVSIWRSCKGSSGSAPDPMSNFLSALQSSRRQTVFMIYYDMIWINLIWGLVNLLPIYPLDGGQATQVVLSQVDRRNGVRRCHIVSLVTAGILAVLSFHLNRHDYFLVMFFGVLAFLNYQVLQSLHQAKRLASTTTTTGGVVESAVHLWTACSPRLQEPRERGLIHRLSQTRNRCGSVLTCSWRVLCYWYWMVASECSTRVGPLFLLLRQSSTIRCKVWERIESGWSGRPGIRGNQKTIHAFTQEIAVCRTIEARPASCFRTIGRAPSGSRGVRPGPGP